jgi:NAD(P)-dependent dehydrogenase (short-subunit alcohol dehydrogenase family)
MMKGKVAIITGAGQGIGESIAKLFASEEMNVVVADIKKEPGKRTVRDIERSGGRSIFVETDVSKKSSTDRMVQKTLKEFGRLDILVNNAGINYVTPIYEEVDEEEWDRVLAINVKGVYFCMRAAAHPMKKQKWGRIINMGSVAGKQGGPGSGIHYSASKAAVMCLTKQFARYLAPYGITVNSIAPGIVDTEMGRSLGPDVIQRTIDLTPLGRLASPEDIARAALFLASEGSAFITGEVLDINGGAFMD